MLKACIIGTGRIASSLEKDPLRPAGCTHAGAYQLRPDIKLAAGADTDKNALQAFGADWAIPTDRLDDSYAEMLRRERPDIVSVCAYAPQRREMALAALAAGAKGLWLEKAVGCSLADGLAIQQAATAAGAAVVVDYPRRARAHYRKVKQLIDEQTYGRLQTVTCHMTHQLVHTGTHAYDVLRYWCGEALSARAQLEHPLSDSGEIQDQGGDGEIRFANGATAFISARRKRYYIFQFDLVFENARILLGNDIAQVYLPAPSQLYTGFKELFPQTSYDWGHGHPRDMAAELVHCLRSGEEPLFSLPNAIESLRIALALFESHRQGGTPIDPHSVSPTLQVQSV